MNSPTTKGTKIEGPQNDEWMLVDAGDIAIHMFNQEGREFYDIDWYLDF
jgi:ribosomal silencing factor RsfS